LQTRPFTLQKNTVRIGLDHLLGLTPSIDGCAAETYSIHARTCQLEQGNMEPKLERTMD
jgi:hypothetical protein